MSTPKYGLTLTFTWNEPLNDKKYRPLTPHLYKWNEKQSSWDLLNPTAGKEHFEVGAHMETRILNSNSSGGEIVSDFWVHFENNDVNPFKGNPDLTQDYDYTPKAAVETGTTSFIAQNRHYWQLGAGKGVQFTSKKNSDQKLIDDWKFKMFIKVEPDPKAVEEAKKNNTPIPQEQQFCWDPEMIVDIYPSS